jgi:spermidine synthase
VKSVWQSIDIYDTMESTRQKNYELAMLQDREYTLEHPELFLPDRVLFLDGVEQSYRHGNAAYHESLVQPALFTHKNPKRVAIIGGGECATLREALKHNTVEKVVMIEIDQVMMDTARTFLPEWNDCSDLEGSNGSCIDDPRAEIYAEDAFKWFADRYLNPDSGEEPFDVIIMDAL